MEPRSVNGEQSERMVIRTAMHRPQITRPQHSRRLSRARGFSVLSSYCGGMADKRVAQVQQASSAIVALIQSGFGESLLGQLWASRLFSDKQPKFNSKEACHSVAYPLHRTNRPDDAYDCLSPDHVLIRVGNLPPHQF